MKEPAHSSSTTSFLVFRRSNALSATTLSTSLSTASRLKPPVSSRWTPQWSQPLRCTTSLRSRSSQCVQLKLPAPRASSYWTRTRRSIRHTMSAARRKQQCVKPNAPMLTTDCRRATALAACLSEEYRRKLGKTKMHAAHIKLSVRAESYRKVEKKGPRQKRPDIFRLAAFPFGARSPLVFTILRRAVAAFAVMICLRRIRSSSVSASGLDSGVKAHEVHVEGVLRCLLPLAFDEDGFTQTASFGLVVRVVVFPHEWNSTDSSRWLQTLRAKEHAAVIAVALVGAHVHAQYPLHHVAERLLGGN